MVASKTFHLFMLMSLVLFVEEGESTIAAKSVIINSKLWDFGFVSQVTSTVKYSGCKNTPSEGSSHCFAIKGIHSARTGNVDMKPSGSIVTKPCHLSNSPFCLQDNTGFIQERATLIPGDLFTIKVSYEDATDTSLQNNTEFTVRITCPFDYLNTFFKQKNLSHCFEGLKSLRPEYNDSQYNLSFLVSPKINFLSYLEIITPSIPSDLTNAETMVTLATLIFTVEIGKTNCLRRKAKEKSFCPGKKLHFSFDYYRIRKRSKLLIPLDWTMNDYEERFVKLHLTMYYYVAKKIVPNFPASEPLQNLKSVENSDYRMPATKIPLHENSTLDFETIKKLKELLKTPDFEAMITLKELLKTPDFETMKKLLESLKNLKKFSGTFPPFPKITKSVPTLTYVPIAPKTTKPVPTSAPVSQPVLGSSSRSIPLRSDSAKLIVGSYKNLCEKSSCIESYQEQDSTRFPKLSERCKCCSRMERLHNLCQAKPDMSIDSPESTVKMGTFVVLSCSFPATLVNYVYPIKWLKDGSDAGFGREVESYSTIRNNRKNVSVVFEIKDAQQQGNYACMVETLAGRKFTSKNLLLLIKDVSYIEFKYEAKDATNISATGKYKNITTDFVKKINESFIANGINFSRVFKTKTTNRSFEIGVTFLVMDTKSRRDMCSKLKHVEHTLKKHGSLTMTSFDCCTSIDGKGPRLILNSFYTSVVTVNDTFEQKTTRRCVWNSTYGAQWKVVNITKFRAAYTFEELDHVHVTKRNSLLASESLVAASNRFQERKGRFDIKLAVEIMEKIVAAEATIRPKIANNFLKVANNIMDCDIKIIARSQRHSRTSERILKLLDEVAKNVELTNSSFKIEEKNMALLVFDLQRKNHSGILIEAFNNTYEPSRIEKKFTSDPISSVKLQASVFLNPSMTRAALNLVNSTDLRITSFIFQNAKFFLSPHHIERQHKSQKHHTRLQRVRKRVKHFRNVFLNSKVISTSFKGVRLRNLSDSAMVEISFDPLRQLKGEHSCVYWDFHAADGQGNWSKEGCINVGMVSGYQKCRCNHLTNFALLLDVNDGHMYLSETEKKSLSIFTYVGCGISLVCLFITFTTYAASRKLRSKQPAQVLMLLCLSLMFMMIAFIVGSRTKHGIVCVVFGLLTHYFLLSSFCWMAIEGINLYLCLVKLMRSTVSKFMLKCNLFAWGTPAVIVGINLGLNEYHSYRRKESHNTICVLTGYDFYLAGLLPMILIMAINLIILILVLRSLSRKSSLGKCNERSNLTKVRIAFGCALLMGITWTVGLFAIGRLTYVVQLLFCALNSLQGFFIFIMYCARHKEVRQEWRKFLNIEFFSSFTSTNKQTKDTKEDDGSGSGSEDATKSKQMQDFAEELNRNETDETKPYDGAMLINNKAFKVTLPGDEAVVVLLHREDKSSFKR